MESILDAEFDRLIADLVAAEEGFADVRAAAWHVFDLVAAEPDLDRAVSMADQMCGEIAIARGLERSVAVYRQRGRDMVRFRAEIAVASRSLSPLTYAKKLRDRLVTRRSPLDLALIDSILSASPETQDAVIALVESGRLRRSGS